MAERQVAIAAPNAMAVNAGLTVAEAGGNAVDAAVAAVIAAACTEAGIVSPMGGAFINVWPRNGRPIVVDGNVEMPGRGLDPSAFGQGLERIHLRYGGGITVHGGHGSVGVPGFFAAAEDAHQRYGLVSWEELLAPTIDVLRRGYILGTAAAYYLTFSGDSLFGWHPSTRAWLAQGGSTPVPTAGQLMRSPDLADTLQAVAERGAAVLYTGEIGDAIAADMAANGGLITRADLAAYRTVLREPLHTRLGRWDAAVNPAPSIGGPVLTGMLRLLARHAEAGDLWPATMIDVQRRILDYRFHHLDVSDDLLGAGAAMVDAIEEIGRAVLATVPSSPDTIHVSTVDSDGTACSVTTSAGYGSGVTVPGTGLMFNNALGEPELNRLGLHALPPGTRMATNMAPTTARRDDAAMLSVGSPGADRITTALAQVLTGICLEDRDIQSAIDAPRLHVAYDSTGTARLEHEDGPGLREAAHDSGLPYLTHEELTMYFGGVGATLRHPDGSLQAAGDPRREAATGIG